MSNPFKSQGVRSWAALIAAYAVVLHSVFGGIVLAQQSALAHGSATVICYGNGGTGSVDDGKASLRHVPCAVCAAVTMAPPPDTVALPLPPCSQGEALSSASAVAPHLARHFSPKRSQAPPASA